ncbi:MAG TPA: gamma-glutamyl-gamma-aminobutyrate hydrolase family protein [Aggregatilineales bacterium]|nr:gamma-glutamyl-gamma-aminobutyrate hydrolase family protein [Anaerolineales bacterium]HRE47491.1 gamma-glutamyl-gamma-aminobutyrate hydrolase family protein [Aggregatilineales bacterium]
MVVPVSKRPLIGIIAALHHEHGVAFYGLLPAYANAVARAGGLPLLIVPTIDEASLRATYERLDGVLMAGGADVDPALYGMPQNPSAFRVYGVDTARDSAESEVVKWAFRDDKPFLGICRGAQIANVALGGSLYRDIEREFPGGGGVKHDLWGVFPRDHYGHTITLNAESRLAEVLDGATTLPVNSLHHQALRDVAAPLRVVALAEDGVIEGVESATSRFFLAVQWHPEELTEKSEPMLGLFKAFVTAAGSAR